MDYKKINEFNCPLVNCIIDETVCYDIQVTAGQGSLFSKRILDDHADLIDISMITDEKVKRICCNCPFNQLRQPDYSTTGNMYGVSMVAESDTAYKP